MQLVCLVGDESPPSRTRLQQGGCCWVPMVRLRSPQGRVGFTSGVRQGDMKGKPGLYALAGLKGATVSGDH